MTTHLYLALRFYDGLIFTCPFFSTRLHGFVKDMISVAVDALILLFCSLYFILVSMNFVIIGILETFSDASFKPSKHAL